MGVERLTMFIVDGQKELEGENRVLQSLAWLTLRCAKEEMESKEELEDTLFRVHFNKRQRQKMIFRLCQCKAQLKATLARS